MENMKTLKDKSKSAIIYTHTHTHTLDAGSRPAHRYTMYRIEKDISYIGNKNE